MHSDLFICPRCGHGPLTCVQNGERESFVCESCHGEYAIIKGIVRFVDSGYADSFGVQWQLNPRTQLDSYTGSTISRDRLFDTTRWPTRLDGKKILEAGSGAGRFTEILATTGAEVYSFDLSQAVNANADNNSRYENLTLFQADIYRLPMRPAQFDGIVAMGVLMHCPDPKQAFLALCRHLAPGGEIAIDVYQKRRHPILLIRPITKRLPYKPFYSFIRHTAPIFVPLKRKLKRIPKIGRYLSVMIPFLDYKGIYPLDDHILLEWSILDTFDALTPTYIYSQTLDSVRAWFEEAGLVDAHIEPSRLHGIVGRGRRSVE